MNDFRASRDLYWISRRTQFCFWVEVSSSQDNVLLSVSIKGGWWVGIVRPVQPPKPVRLNIIISLTNYITVNEQNDNNNNCPVYYVAATTMIETNCGQHTMYFIYSSYFDFFI